MRRTASTAPLIVILVAAALLLATIAATATVPPTFSESIVASGLSNPTAMAFAPDGRIFISQQGGSLRVVKNGALLPAPFLTMTVSSAGERGLLGVAFDPAFASNQWVYVYYTATSPTIHNRVSRFTANGDVVVPGSELVILDLNDLSSATNHNGGSIHFGPDGQLYVAVGENANSSNSQTLANLLGKMLRINADGSIPTDNPFYNTATGVNRAIWAMGLRNPFTFDFQPGSGRMFINDVGQNAWEEIDDGIAGSNYGWPNSEGATSNAGERGPLYFYGHGTGAMLGCAITGGTFYNPDVVQFPASYVGNYFFADYCGNWINRVDPANGFAVTTFATAIAAPIDLHVGPDGRLYYLARGTGATTGVLGQIQFGATTGSISGKVTDSITSAAISGATVTISGGGSPTTTDASGNYTFSGRAPGPYTVAASKAGYTPSAATPVTVSAGATTTQNFALVPLPPTTGTISGQVTNASGGAAIAAATVTIGPSGPSTTTNSLGNYTFSGLAPASYSLTAAKSGFSTSAPAAVVVTAGLTTTRNFALTALPTLSTGFKFGTTASAVTSSAGDNNGYQSGAANLFSFNSAVATDTSSGTGSSQSCTSSLRDKENVSGYSFALPGTAVLKGITVQIRGRASSTSSTPKFCVLLSWNGGTSWTAGKLTPTLGTTLTTYTLGSATDLWGRTWTPANFASASFRVRIVDLANSTSRTFYCDGVSVQLTYQ